MEIKSIGDLLSPVTEQFKIGPNKLSPIQALDSYKHIQLTEEEEAAAILEAKQKKETALKYLEEQKRIDEGRRRLTTDKWDYETTKNFMLSRRQTLFEGQFSIDNNNQIIYDLLLRYFSEDKDFISMASAIGINAPSLNKGILLAGTFGTGKTWMMKLFQKNKRNCFLLKNAKEISSEFQKDGQEMAELYIKKKKNAFNDATFFYQPYCGLCIDDLGTEEIKSNYGNKSNVIGDLLEMRYAAGDTGIFLHATTNLNGKGINDFYGPRVASRMREVFNILELNGEDRRK